MTAPTKAKLEIEGKPNAQWIPCLFNPDQLSMTKKVTWSPEQVAGTNAPQLKFDKGSSGTLGFTLTFDTTDTGASVTSYTSALLALMDVDTTKKRPPWVRFRWGTLVSFKAVLESATINFTYFSSEGKPLRATAQLALTQFENEGKYPLQNPTSGTPTLDRMHRVQPGETLDRISYTYYGDSTLWRLIARRNGILDPLRMNAGRLLIVPEREVAARA
jgi:hypothetical protein